MEMFIQFLTFFIIATSLCLKEESNKPLKKKKIYDVEKIKDFKNDSFDSKTISKDNLNARCRACNVIDFINIGYSFISGVRTFIKKHLLVIYFLCHSFLILMLLGFILNLVRCILILMNLACGMDQEPVPMEIVMMQKDLRE